MAVTAHVFPQFFIGAAEGYIALTGGTYKVALSNTAGPVTESTSGISTAKLWTDWTSNVAAEITGTGYSAGGQALSGISLAAGGSNNTVATFTASANPSWTSASFTANQAIVYESSASTYQLICWWDFGGAVTVTSGTFTLNISASGLLTATAS